MVLPPARPPRSQLRQTTIIPGDRRTGHHGGGGDPVGPSTRSWARSTAAQRCAARCVACCRRFHGLVLLGTTSWPDLSCARAAAGLQDSQRFADQLASRPGWQLGALAGRKVAGLAARLVAGVWGGDGRNRCFWYLHCARLVCQGSRKLHYAEAGHTPK